MTEQMGQGRSDLRAWDAALARVLQAGLDAERTRATTEAQRRDLNRRRMALRAERAALEQGASTRAYLVEVVARCPAGRQAQVQLSYPGYTGSRSTR